MFVVVEEANVPNSKKRGFYIFFAGRGGDGSASPSAHSKAISGSYGAKGSCMLLCVMGQKFRHRYNFDELWRGKYIC